ncbi:MAG: GAF domain-containing SpoIIE family protein phosphatase [Bryobacteraceae bacterium]
MNPVNTGRGTPFKDRSELLDFLLEVATATAATLDLDKLLKDLAAFVEAVVPSGLIAILLYSERLKGLVVRYQVGYNPDSLKDLVIPLDEGLTGVAASARMPIVEGDVRSHPHYLPGLDAVQSEMAIPMIARGKLVGVIDVQSTSRNAFTQEHSAMVQLIASRASAAIVNARLFRRLDRQNRTLRTLSAISREFSSTLNLDEILNKAANAVRRLISYDAFTILLADEQAGMLRSRLSLRYDKRVRLDNLPMGEGITGAAAQSREPVLVEDTLADDRYVETSTGIRSELAVPLLLQDRLIGVMDLESERVGSFTEDHVQTMRLLAPLVASAVENARLYGEVDRRKRRMEADLAAARALQQTLLPREDPEIPGLEIGIAFRPAAEISGDVFDFFEREDAALIVFGDVSGKSAAAALYGSMVTGLLRTLAPRRKNPAALVEALNEALLEKRVGDKYLTLMVMLWEPKTGSLRMANAAASPPLVLRRGHYLKPHSEGFPLGLFAGAAYEETTFATQPGDLVVLYSDGIQDQSNTEGAIYGDARLEEFLLECAEAPAREIADGLIADLDRFRGGARIHDDQTVVAIRIAQNNRVARDGDGI